MTAAVSMAVVSAAEDAGADRRGIEDEGELAALREQKREPERVAACAYLKSRATSVDADRLDRHEDRRRGDDRAPRPRAISDEVERHADAEEEQAEQEAAEGLDVRLELMAEARFGEEHAGEEGAHRHRQAADLHDEGGAEHDEQRRRRHDLARLGVRRRCGTSG